MTGINVTGRAVNEATFSGTGQRGWRITTSEYDKAGNVTRSLSAANRDRAVYATAATATSLGLPGTTTSAYLARALDTTSIYTGDGVDLLEAFAPYQQVTIPGTSGTVTARAHTKHSYGTRSAPDVDPTVDGPLHQVVETTTGASLHDHRRHPARHRGCWKCSGFAKQATLNGVFALAGAGAGKTLSSMYQGVGKGIRARQYTSVRGNRWVNTGGRSRAAYNAVRGNSIKGYSRRTVYAGPGRSYYAHNAQVGGALSYLSWRSSWK